MGFIAMKALSGGLITTSAAAYAYLAKFDNVASIPGESSGNMNSMHFCPPLTILRSSQRNWEAVIEHDRKGAAGRLLPRLPDTVCRVRRRLRSTPVPGYYAFDPPFPICGSFDGGVTEYDDED